MNFINRAIKNITRVKSKSILLMITFFILGNLVIVGLGISHAVSAAKVETRRKMRAVVSYELDWQKINDYVNGLETEEEREQFYQNYPSITKSNVEAIIGMDDRILTANYIQSRAYYSDGFETLAVEGDGQGGGIMIAADGTQMEYRSPNIQLRGNILPNYLEFVDSQYELLEGRMYTQAELDSYAKVVLVEKGLADLNGFKVGDTISVATDDVNNLDMNYPGISSEDAAALKLELEIIGIYDNKVEFDPNNQDYQWNQYLIPDNGILIPATTLVRHMIDTQKAMDNYYAQVYPEWAAEGEIEYNEDNYYYGTVYILLNDPLEVEDFIADNQDKVGQFMTLDGDLENFKQISRPLDAMARFADALVGIIVVNALVIVTLITALTLKNREYEIGVLLSMGVSKLKVIGQMFIELLIVGLIGFTLAVGSSSLLSKVVGDWMLSAQMSTELEVDTSDDWSWIGDEDYFTDVTQEDLFSEYEVKVDFEIILMIYGGGILVIFISVVIPGLMVMRYNPKEILTNAR